MHLYAFKGLRRGPLFAGLSLLTGRRFAGMRVGKVAGASVGLVTSTGGRHRPAAARHDPAEELRRAEKALAAAQERHARAVAAAERQ